jgi:hypothetical protein
MAETFTNATLALPTQAITTTNAQVYTCPTTASSAIVIGCNISNIDGTNSVDVDFGLDIDGGSTIRYYVKDSALAAGNSVNPVLGRAVIGVSQVLRARGSAASDAEVVLSIMEITA